MNVSEPQQSVLVIKCDSIVSGSGSMFNRNVSFSVSNRFGSETFVSRIVEGINNLYIHTVYNFFYLILCVHVHVDAVDTCNEITPSSKTDIAIASDTFSSK